MVKKNALDHSLGLAIYQSKGKNNSTIKTLHAYIKLLIKTHESSAMCNRLNKRHLNARLFCSEQNQIDLSDLNGEKERNQCVLLPQVQ